MRHPFMLSCVLACAFLPTLATADELRYNQVSLRAEVERLRCTDPDSPELEEKAAMLGVPLPL